MSSFTETHNWQQVPDLEIGKVDTDSSGQSSVVGIVTAYGAGRSADRIPVGARFSAPVQTGPEAHPASCKMGTGSFSRVECGRSVTLTTHPF